MSHRSPANSTPMRARPVISDRPVETYRPGPAIPPRGEDTAVPSHRAVAFDPVPGFIKAGEEAAMAGRTLRERITEALAEGPQRARDLVRRLGANRDYTYRTLQGMLKLGEVRRIGIGTYALPGSPDTTKAPPRKGDSDKDRPQARPAPRACRAEPPQGRPHGAPEPAQDERGRPGTQDVDTALDTMCSSLQASPVVIRDQALKVRVLRRLAEFTEASIAEVLTQIADDLERIGGPRS